MRWRNIDERGRDGRLTHLQFVAHTCSNQNESRAGDGALYVEVVHIGSVVDGESGECQTSKNAARCLGDRCRVWKIHQRRGYAALVRGKYRGVELAARGRVAHIQLEILNAGSLRELQAGTERLSTAIVRSIESPGIRPVIGKGR